MSETQITGSVTGSVELLSKKRLCAVIDLIREASKLGVKRIEMAGIKLVFQSYPSEYETIPNPYEKLETEAPSDEELLMNPYAGLGSKGKA